MKIEVSNLSKFFGIEELFSNVNFEIARGDKVGFVGGNGAGKTTLFKIILGNEDYDKGVVKIDSGASVGYVEQQANFNDHTLYEEFKSAFSDVLELEAKKSELEKLMETDKSAIDAYEKVLNKFEHLGGYDFESKINRVAFGLGFTKADLNKNANHFSGGQKTRICLAKALLREPDFLLLDEPTNHLDIKMIEWLEDFLTHFNGGVFIISHDRFFLDKVAKRILALENKTVTNYDGNYTYYMKVKTARREALLTAYEKQEEKIKKTEEFIRKYKAGVKAKQARGRESQLKRMERIVLPKEEASFTYFKLHTPPPSAERVLELEDVAFSYDNREIFAGVNLLIRKGDGATLIGPNGAGKTTLLKLVMSELNPTKGEIRVGSRVKIAYFSQHHEGLNKERRIIDEITYEYGLGEDEARNYLGAFLFKGDDVFRVIGELSGGEQSRLAFLKLMLDGANFLILDEPTNHLDIPAKEAVEEALLAYPGTFLAVSHDRYFLDKVGNVTFEIENGKLTEYNGSYSYYREKKSETEDKEDKIETKILQKSESVKKNSEKISENTINEEENSTSRAKKSIYGNLTEDKKAEKLARMEAEIAMAEAELKMLEIEMNDQNLQADLEKSAEIAKAYEEKTAEIEKRYEDWEALAEA